MRFLRRTAAASAGADARMAGAPVSVVANSGSVILDLMLNKHLPETE